MLLNDHLDSDDSVKDHVDEVCYSDYVLTTHCYA